MITNHYERIAPLLTHGVSHSVGCDHEDDEDHELMAQKEQETWKLLKDEFKTAQKKCIRFFKFIFYLS